MYLENLSTLQSAVISRCAPFGIILFCWLCALPHVTISGLLIFSPLFIHFFFIQFYFYQFNFFTISYYFLFFFIFYSLFFSFHHFFLVLSFFLPILGVPNLGGRICGSTISAIPLRVGWSDIDLWGGSHIGRSSLSFVWPAFPCGTASFFVGTSYLVFCFYSDPAFPFSTDVPISQLQLAPGLGSVFADSFSRLLIDGCSISHPSPDRILWFPGIPCMRTGGSATHDVTPPDPPSWYWAEGDAVRRAPEGPRP